MSVILSIETATSTCSLALHAKGKLVAIQELHVANSHAESLPLAIEHLLSMAHYTPSDLAAVAISSGPGSYTGLRIGASTAKGLCYALGIPLISVGTLEAMAHGMQCYNVNRSLLCPMIDARRMEVYCLLTDAQNQILDPPHAQLIDEYSFQMWLADHTILFFGDGAAKCMPLLDAHSNATFVEGIYPSAHHVGTLAYNKFQQTAFEEVAYFEPLYLKLFQKVINTAQ